MAIVTKQQILDAIRERFADDNSDETLALIENISDTIDDYENKTNDTTNWKEKYDQNDKAWREKYKARFFSAGDEAEEEKEDEEKPVATSYDDLFKEEK